MKDDQWGGGGGKGYDHYRQRPPTQAFMQRVPFDGYLLDKRKETGWENSRKEEQHFKRPMLPRARDEREVHIVTTKRFNVQFE